MKKTLKLALEVASIIIFLGFLFFMTGLFIGYKLNNKKVVTVNDKNKPILLTPQVIKEEKPKEVSSPDNLQQSVTEDKSIEQERTTDKNIKTEQGKEAFTPQSEETVPDKKIVTPSVLYNIHLYVSRSEQMAEQKAVEIAEALKDEFAEKHMSINIEEQLSGTITLYYIYLGYLETEKEAKKIAENLVSQGVITVYKINKIDNKID